MMQLLLFISEFFPEKQSSLTRYTKKMIKISE